MKKLFTFVLLVGLILLLTSCATSVPIEYLVPATYDLSDYRDLALASVVPYKFSIFNRPARLVSDHSAAYPVSIGSGYDTLGELELARFATDLITRDLQRADYFRLLASGETDSYLNRGSSGYQQLERLGFTALFEAEISQILIDEYIYATEKEVPPKDNPAGAPQVVKEFFLMQKVYLAFTWEVSDLKSGRILAKGRFEDEKRKTTQLDAETDRSFYAPSLEPLFEELLRAAIEPIASSVVPHWKTSYVSLMKAKPSSAEFDQAYQEVRNGNLAYALEQFQVLWEDKGLVEAGHNAALLLEAVGRQQEAIALMEEVYRQSYNQDINRVLRQMRERYAQHSAGVSQL